jgi:hypothetical protein
MQRKLYVGHNYDRHAVKRDTRQQIIENEDYIQYLIVDDPDEDFFWITHWED